MMGRNRNAGKPGAKNPGKTFKRIMAEIMGRYKLHCVAVVLCLINLRHPHHHSGAQVLRPVAL